MQLLQSGSIVLKQLTPSGYRDLTIGHLTDYYYQREKLVFSWNYYSYTLKYKCDQLDVAIDRHISKDRQETIRIVAANNRQLNETDNNGNIQKKLGKNARKKLARKIELARKEADS